MSSSLTTSNTHTHVHNISRPHQLQKLTVFKTLAKKKKFKLKRVLDFEVGTVMLLFLISFSLSGGFDVYVNIFWCRARVYMCDLFGVNFIIPRFTRIGKYVSRIIFLELQNLSFDC